MQNKEEAAKTLAEMVDEVETKIKAVEKFAAQHELEFCFDFSGGGSVVYEQNYWESDGYSYRPAGAWYSSSYDC